MGTIHNHYIPQYYLSGFSNPTTSAIWMYQKESNEAKETTVKSVANQLRYWPDEIETYLANEIENPGNSVIKKIRNRQTITDEDKWILSKYIIVMMKRVPVARDRVLSAAPERIESIIERLKAELTGYKGQHPDKASLIDRRLEEFEKRKGEMLEKIPHQAWQDNLAPERTPIALSAIYQMTWVFFTADKKRGFLASDNPVFFFRHMGIGKRESELVFPVSENIALWATWRADLEERYLPAEEKYVSEFNLRTVRTADRFIFYSGLKNWILALIKRDRKKMLNLIAPK